MADFSNLALTVRGVKALLEAQAGVTLKLSKIGMGSGTATGSIVSISDMVKPETMLPISEIKMDSDSGYMTIIAKMTNEDITEGFYWRETGLFFESPDGNDVLFAYTCTADKYDYVPAYSDKRYVKHVRIADIITNSADITVIEKQGLLYVDTLTFSEFKDELYLYYKKILDTVFERLVENELFLQNHIKDKTNPHNVTGDQVFYTAPDGSKHWFGIDSEGVYIESADDEGAPEGAMLLLGETKDTGYYAEIDGRTYNIENAVKSASELTEGALYFELK